MHPPSLAPSLDSEGKTQAKFAVQKWGERLWSSVKFEPFLPQTHLPEGSGTNLFPENYILGQVEQVITTRF